MEEEYLDVTRAFQDVFASATPGSLQYMQDHSEDLEAGRKQQFIGRKEQKPIQIDVEYALILIC